MNKSPIKHSLYNHILTEMLVEAREKGESSLYFEDVDKKVLQIAKAVVKWEIRYKGERYNSPSLAGKAARGRNTNGWTFWHYLRGPGDWVPIDNLRK